MLKTNVVGIVLIVSAVILGGQAFAQDVPPVIVQTPTGNFIDSTVNLITVVATLIGTIGAVILAIVPLLRGEIKKKVQIVADSLVQTDNYMKEQAKTIAENKGNIQIVKDAAFNIAKVSDKDSKIVDEMLTKGTELENKVADEAKRDTEELEKVHNVLKEAINK